MVVKFLLLGRMMTAECVSIVDDCAPIRVMTLQGPGVTVVIVHCEGFSEALGSA